LACRNVRWEKEVIEIDFSLMHWVFFSRSDSTNHTSRRASSERKNLMMYEITSAASSWVRMIDGSRIWSIRFGGWSSSERWKGLTWRRRRRRRVITKKICKVSKN
jgi:hypothetical protein